VYYKNERYINTHTYLTYLLTYLLRLDASWTGLQLGYLLENATDRPVEKDFTDHHRPNEDGWRRDNSILRSYGDNKFYAHYYIVISDLVWDGRQLAGGVKAHEPTNERTVAESFTPGCPGQRCSCPDNSRLTRRNSDRRHVTLLVPVSCPRFAHLSNLANLHRYVQLPVITCC